jgi:hypothetical protein
MRLVSQLGEHTLDERYNFQVRCGVVFSDFPIGFGGYGFDPLFCPSAWDLGYGVFRHRVLVVDVTLV